MKHDLESLLEQIGFSSFLSRARIITFSPPRTRSKPPSLEAFYHFSGILTDFNSLPPASLVLLHFNCDFHAYLTRSRSTCIKCPSGINWLLVLKPRLFGYNLTLAFFCSQWQISIFDYSSYFRSLHHSSNRRGTAFLQKS